MKKFILIIISVITLSLSAFALFGCAKNNNNNNGNNNNDDDPIELPFVPA